MTRIVLLLAIISPAVVAQDAHWATAAKDGCGTSTTLGSNCRFRCASTYGYGASASMVERCLARLDENGITGHVRITRALCDVHPVGTQGANFLVGRRPA